MFVASNPNNNSVKLWNATTATGQVLLDTFVPTVGYHNLGALNASAGVFCTMGSSPAIVIDFHIKFSD